MSETNGTGIQYPTLELGGVTYTVKFTRGGILYRLQKNGGSFEDLSVKGKNFSAITDILFAALFGQFQGTVEDLAELLLAEAKISEAGDTISEALKKVSPPTLTPAAGTVGLEVAAPKVQ